MAVSLVVGQNSYIDVAYADNYFSQRLFADAWETADADTKTKAILMATSKIERQPLRGMKVDIDQIMQFPRALYSYEPRHRGLIGINITIQRISYGPGWYPEDNVSDEVKQAVCEEALAILQFGNSKRISLQKQGVKAFNMGGMSETLSGNKITFLSQEAKELLKRYLAGSASIT